MKAASDRHRRALAHLRRRKWPKAHELVMDLEDPLAFHIHGLVHRLEGDMENARYWYKRAGVAFGRSLRLAAELKAIEAALQTAAKKALAPLALPCGFAAFGLRPVTARFALFDPGAQKRKGHRQNHRADENADQPEADKTADHAGEDQQQR
jgi:hypothetical protein